MSKSEVSSSNRLLLELTPGELEIVGSCLERVDLRAGDVLAEPDKPAPYAYFLESGIAATVLSNRAGQSVDCGLTGNEGIIGLSLVFGVAQCPREAVMLVQGSAHRIAADALGSIIDALPHLRTVLLNYVHTFIIQLSSTAFASSTLTVEKRLARWLLMAQDRLGSSEIFLTHDFYATVLGVRRPGVTNALHVLEGEHLIRSRRGRTVILDRPALEDLVGSSCYGLAEREYRRVFAPRSSDRAGSLDGPTRQSSAERPSPG